MKIALLIVTAFISLTIYAQNKVIYGQNGLRTPDQIPLYSDLIGATAGMVSSYRLQDAGDDYSLLSRKTEFCEGEPLNNEVKLAKCTGFLIADDILVTAGHCVTDEISCVNNQWVFDFNEQSATSLRVKKSSVYRCAKVLHTEKNLQTKADYAIIKLDRKTQGRIPMQLSSGELSINDHLMTLGHPLGTSIKLSINGTVRSNSNPIFFMANLDTFHGNSGSPVINQSSGDVEGILVRGEKDSYFDAENGCLRIKRCKDGECRGEDVIRTSVILKKLADLGLSY